MSSPEGARTTVIAAVIGMSAGFLAIVIAAILAVSLAGNLAPYTSEGLGVSRVLWQLILNGSVACLLGFSVWVQAWTRGLSYSWLRCTLSSLTGALLAAALAYLLARLFGKP